MKVLNLFCIILVIFSIVTLFTINDRVRSLNITLEKSRAELDKKKKSIKVLNADWAMLNDPKRLRDLGSIHLGLQHSTLKDFINLEDIPFSDEYLRKTSLSKHQKKDKK